MASLVFQVNGFFFSKLCICTYPHSSLLRLHSVYNCECTDRCWDSLWCTPPALYTVRCPTQWGHCPDQSEHNCTLLLQYPGSQAAYTQPAEQHTRTWSAAQQPSWVTTGQYIMIHIRTHPLVLARIYFQMVLNRFIKHPFYTNVKWEARLVTAVGRI